MDTAIQIISDGIADQQANVWQVSAPLLSHRLVKAIGQALELRIAQMFAPRRLQVDRSDQQFLIAGLPFGNGRYEFGDQNFELSSK